MSITDDVFGIPESKTRLVNIHVLTYCIKIIMFSTSLVCTTQARPLSPTTDGSQSPPRYIFSQPFELSQKINSELEPILGNVKIRIISGGIINTADFNEWTDQMGKANTVKYQQAFYAAFAEDNGPKSMSNIRVRGHDGSTSMNCIISHPNTDWHVTWALGGLNMSMDYADNDYNLNDVSEFILYHESKHCISHFDSIILNENLSDIFAALLYRSKHHGKTKMLNDIIAFRRYQIESTSLTNEHDFKQSAYHHDSRHALQKVINLDFDSDIQGLSIGEINTLANEIILQFPLR